MAVSRLDMRQTGCANPRMFHMKYGKTPAFTGVFHIFHKVFHRRKYIHPEYDKFSLVNIIQFPCKETGQIMPRAAAEGSAGRVRNSPAAVRTIGICKSVVPALQSDKFRFDRSV